MPSSAPGNAVRTAVITTTSGDRSIQATVTRKRVKNLNLRVHADGTVTMSIPMRTSIARAQDFLDRKAPWIAQRLERIEAARNSRGIIHPAAAPAGSADAVTKPRLLLWGEEVDAYSTLQKHGLLPEVFGGADSNAADAGIDTARLQRLVDVLYKQEVARAIPQIAQPLESAMEPLAGAQHEDALGILHAKNGGDPHQLAARRLSNRLSKLCCRARAGPPYGTQP